MSYLYRINYPLHEKNLALMEMRTLFNIDSEEKIFFSEIEIDPSDSAFLKGRLKILFSGENFQEILSFLERENFQEEEFKVEYFKLEEGDSPFEERQKLCRNIGLRIVGIPNMSNPKKVLGITKFREKWYFGIYLKNDLLWQSHINKPHSYSNSLGVKTAKGVINFATGGDKKLRIIDTCAGIGTIVMEGLSAGVDIIGIEINPIIAQNARENLNHYGYPERVFTGDMLEVKDQFHSSILDIPYGIFSHITSQEQQALIDKTRKISNRMILVTFENLREMVLKAGFKVLDSCEIPKGKFKRYIFICE